MSNMSSVVQMGMRIAAVVLLQIADIDIIKGLNKNFYYQLAANS